MERDVNKDICELFNAQDKRGIDLLFQVYYTPLVLWANTFLNDLPAAEDLVQDFFIAVWEKKIYKSFFPHNLSVFLRVSIKNKALNVLTKKGIEFDNIDIERVVCFWEEYDGRREEIMNIVWKEISVLPSRSQEVMNLAFQKGMKYQEIADLLDISLSTVKNTIAKSIQKLQAKLNDDILVYFFFSLKR